MRIVVQVRLVLMGAAADSTRPAGRGLGAGGGPRPLAACFTRRRCPSAARSLSPSAQSVPDCAQTSRVRGVFCFPGTSRRSSPGDSVATDPATALDFHVFDTTLRDGAQREGVSYSVADKLAVARLLDEIGVGFIEGGWPGALPKDTEFFSRARSELKLRHAQLVAFGSTRKAGVRVEDD